MKWIISSMNCLLRMPSDLGKSFMPILHYYIRDDTSLPLLLSEGCKYNLQVEYHFSASLSLMYIRLYENSQFRNLCDFNTSSQLCVYVNVLTSAFCFSITYLRIYIFNSLQVFTVLKMFCCCFLCALSESQEIDYINRSSSNCNSKVV